MTRGLSMAAEKEVLDRRQCCTGRSGDVLIGEDGKDENLRGKNTECRQSLNDDGEWRRVVGRFQ